MTVNLRATPGDRRVRLEWDDPGDITISGYQYRYMNTLDGAWNPDWTDISGSDATTISHTLSGLTNYLRYTFEVRALGDSQVGPPATASATPQGPPTVPLAPANLDAIGNDEGLWVRWQEPPDEHPLASVTSFRVRYREVGTSAWSNVSRANDDDSGSQNIAGLTNRRAYEVQVAAVNRVGTGGWASVRGTPQAPWTPPPTEPEGDQRFNVGQLGVYLDHPDADGNLLQIDSCSGTLSFRVIWAGPDGNTRQADEWAAHINTSGGAGEVSYSFRQSPGVHDGPYFEMNGTVRVEGNSNLTLQVRGRFGSNWGEWSPRASLFCYETE